MSVSLSRDPSQATVPYRDPTPLPENVPRVDEVGTTSAPLKSASYFLGAFCKEYNGTLFRCFVVIWITFWHYLRSFRGFHVMQVWKSRPWSLLERRPSSYALCYRPVGSVQCFTLSTTQSGMPESVDSFFPRINKLRENCLKEWDAHWECLERNNQVCAEPSPCGTSVKVFRTPSHKQEFYACRKPERTFNKCVFDKLVYNFFLLDCANDS